MVKREKGGKWSKGHSGNPGGGRAMTPEVRQAFVDLTLPAVEELKKILEGKNPALKMKAIEVIFNRSLGANPKPIVDVVPPDAASQLAALEKAAVQRAVEGDSPLLALLLKALAPEKYGDPDDGDGDTKERSRLHLVKRGEARAGHKPESAEDADGDGDEGGDA